MNALELIQYLDSELCLADIRKLNRDQLIRLQEAFYHWTQLTQREMRDRHRLEKKEGPE
jgi:hypothetical protein